MAILRGEPALTDAGTIANFHAADNSASFAITDTKLYVPVLTLSTQDNAKLLE